MDIHFIHCTSPHEQALPLIITHGWPGSVVEFHKIIDALTDLFIRRGHTLVSDDKVATFHGQGTHWAVPSHPNHRPYRKFEDLGMRVDRFDPRARPVDAVYRLVRAEPGAAVSISFRETSRSRRDHASAS